MQWNGRQWEDNTHNSDCLKTLLFFSLNTPTTCWYTFFPHQPLNQGITVCVFLVSTVRDLLERTVIHGEGNSLLIVGSQGCGKSWVCDIMDQSEYVVSSTTIATFFSYNN